MSPLLVMVCLLRLSIANSQSAKPPRLYTARHGTARRGDFRLGRVRAGKLALGPFVPAARVVEIALEDVHDAVDPRRQGRLLLLDDLVRLLPVSRRQQFHGLPERFAHVALIFRRASAGGGPRPPTARRADCLLGLFLRGWGGA